MSKIYIPSMQWKMAEYQALLRLSDEVKNKIYPLIVIPPVGFDFEEQKPKKTVEEHLEGFPDKLHKKWPERAAILEVHESLHEEYMYGGQHIVEFLYTECAANSSLVALVRVQDSESYINQVEAHAPKCNGLAIKIVYGDMRSPDLGGQVQSLLTKFDMDRKNVDLIIDLKDGGGAEVADFSEFLYAQIQRIPQISEFRTFCFLGTSLKMKEIASPGGEMMRIDFELFQQFRFLHGREYPNLCFSDYNIDSPFAIDDTGVDFDPRKMAPAAKLIYSTYDQWYVRKGSKFRGNSEQMKNLCADIASNTAIYRGREFSWGDEKIYETAYGTPENFGSLTVWKQVGINHHFTLVVDSLSSFHGDLTYLESQ